MDRDFEYKHSRGKSLSLMMGIIYSLGILIESLTRQTPDALVMFTVYTSYYLGYYFIFSRRGKVPRGMEYILGLPIVLFCVMSISNDPNIVFYGANVFLFIVIATLQNIRMSLIASVIIQGVSGFIIYTHRDLIFTEAVTSTPDVIVYFVVTGFVHIAAIYQNQTNRKIRLQSIENEKIALESKREVEKILMENQKSVLALDTFNRKVGDNIELSNGASKEMVDSFGEMIAALDTQDESIQTIQDSIASINHDIVSANQAFSASDVSLNETRNTVRDGIQDVTRLKQNMNELEGMFNRNVKASSELEVNSGEINGIISQIMEISHQINLLSLNACIEAQRAGEHGKGFLVVAEEVRKLAEKTSSSTKQIEDILQVILSRVKQVSEETKGSQHQMASSVSSTSAVEKVFSTVSEQHLQVIEKNRIVKEMLEQLVSSLSEISYETTQVSTVSEENNSSIRALSDQLKKVSAIMNETSEDLEILNSEMKLLSKNHFS